MSSNDQLTTARWHLINSAAKMPWGALVNQTMLAVLNETLGFAPPDYRPIPIADLPPVESPQRIALCLGHARAIDEGNVGAGGISEEDFNLEIIELLKADLESHGIDVVTYTWYEGGGYTSAMEWLAKKLLADKVTAAVEFHFNAQNKTARGHETLHWKSSVRGVTLAKCLNDAIGGEFPDSPDRGLKPKVHTDRGALFLSLTHCPAAIAEPFFGDTLSEWRAFSSAEGKGRLVRAYSKGIRCWISSQKAAA